MTSRIRVGLTRLGVVGAVAATAVAVPAPAQAAFDVLPTACAVAPDASSTYAVFGYDNPNPETVTVGIGSNNMVLQPPNSRPGQQTEFAPGRHETAWVEPFEPTNPRRSELTWFLQGATVTARAGLWCAGATPVAPAPASLITERRVGDPLQVGDALQVVLPPAPAGTIARASIERCVGDVCVPAAATPTYVVTAADAGHQLRLRMITLSAAGWASVVSAPTAPVAGDEGSPLATDVVGAGPPIAREQPTVPGSPTVGETFVADIGEWNGAAPLTVEGEWQRCEGTTCVAVAGATSPTYTPTGADEGSTLRWVSIPSTTGVAGSVPGLPVRAVAASAPSLPVAPARPTPPITPPTTPTPTPTAPPVTKPHPAITALRLQPAVFRVGPRAVALIERRAVRRRAARGTTVVLGLATRSFVRVDVVGRGRTVTLTRWLDAGTSRLALSGRFPRTAGGALAPGRYRLVVQARDIDGAASRTASRGFRVIR